MSQCAVHLHLFPSMLVSAFHCLLQCNHQRCQCDEFLERERGGGGEGGRERGREGRIERKGKKNSFMKAVI